MPSVSRISIAPVKGLALVHPDEVQLEKSGVPSNRRFHVVDADGRRYNQLRNGRLVQIEAEYDPDAGRLTLRFPDGTVAEQIFFAPPLVITEQQVDRILEIVRASIKAVLPTQP